MKNEEVKQFVEKYDAFEVKEHSDHQRLYHIELNHEYLNTFLSENHDVNVQQLEYVPYMRLVLAQSLQNVFGKRFSGTMRAILHDRKSGGFTMGMQQQTTHHEQYVLFATALTHLLGGVNFDDMSGKYYARFIVKDTDNSDSYLRQAYRLFTLHTDGTFFDEATDWLLMMKFAEENAVGGESRLLHLDDWEDLEKFSTHPIATCGIQYKAPSSKNVNKTVYNQTFFQQNGKPCVCFIDQFAYPATLEQAAYLKDLSISMENSPATVALPLPVGDLVMVNNTFWLHGRASFEKNPKLHRELMRIRGYFSVV
ncbi:glutarate dioxygenase GlaH [Chengkuizengella axinellae]|uniref:Glutarate dioxygenase GlaH n=1 Tax=Chengkuizengella axinellae TaxID=3064388 RepID=A0ABT9J335_9BACL|nr:glutarate dioxygenase GlaH [Chengkuizengella sp. 2205SS18-9]MDP5276008.1 glutarate dioxygenase GlaH [Chengkuizengella sp. 2205SS18-9]